MGVRQVLQDSSRNFQEVRTWNRCVGCYYSMKHAGNRERLDHYVEGGRNKRMRVPSEQKEKIENQESERTPLWKRV